MRRLTDYLKDYTLQVLWIWDHLNLSISGFFYTDKRNHEKNNTL